MCLTKDNEGYMFNNDKCNMCLIMRYFVYFILTIIKIIILTIINNLC